MGSAMEHRSADVATSAPLVAGEFSGVLDAYNRSDIDYCYWKSTGKLASVLAGEGDLDLLVDPTDWHRAISIALASGYKLAPSRDDQRHAGMLSLLAYTENNGRWRHLHLHSRVFIGSPWLKNITLPIARNVLARSELNPQFQVRTLDAYTEAMLLVVRASQELGPWSLPRPGRRATKALAFSADQQRLAALLERKLLTERFSTLLDPEVAHSAAEIFLSGQPIVAARPLLVRIRRSLAGHRTYRSTEAQLREFGQVASAVGGRLLTHVAIAGRPFRRAAPAGGFTVAIIGVDGTGKSTSVGSMRKWLGAKFDITPIYFGTGDGRPSLLLWPFKIAEPLVRKLFRHRPSRATHNLSSGPTPPGSKSFSLMLTVWAVVVALDKRQKLRHASRAAARGMIVIADRYPQDQIAGFNDGPLLTHLSGVPEWLRQWERRIYALARRHHPDLVIKLVAPPDIISLREPGLHPANIPGRIANIRSLDFPRSRVVIVNAEQPLPEMLRSIRREVWQHI